MLTENEKQLTAMSELISELQNIRKRYIGDSGVHDGARMALDKAIEIAKSKLATERQNLIDAVAWLDESGDHYGVIVKRVEEYLDNTFKKA